MDFTKIREKTLLKLKDQGYVSNVNLPVLNYTQIRNVKDIADRINVLHIFYAIHLEGEKSIAYFHQVLIDNNWEKYLTPQEKAFFDKGVLNKANTIDFSWLKEAIYAMLYSLSFVDKSNFEYYIKDEIDISNHYSSMPPEMDYELFIKKSNLIGETEVFEWLDFYYCFHWVLKKKNVKKSLMNFFVKAKSPEIAVIIERRKALEWICNSKLEWDDISLDT